MTSFIFQTVPHIVVQAGAAASLGELLKKRFPVSRVCVVTDNFLYTSGLLQPALDSLAASGFEVLVISDVQPDPPEHVVLEITERARAFGTELVIGLGGGSSMDVAKLVAVTRATVRPLPIMVSVRSSRCLERAT